MNLGKRFLCLIWLWAALGPAIRSEVLLRWTINEIPPAKTLGVIGIVIPWNEDGKKLLPFARRQGFRVYVEAGTDSLAAVAEAVSKESIAGIILRIDRAERTTAEETLPKVREMYPKLSVRTVDTRGKQPDMKGWLVFKKDGILQVSSPTSQPWIDSNLALVRYERSLGSAETPVYTFSWDLSDPLQQKQGPGAEDYSLAVAEAGAFHADLILQIPENQQKALAEGNAEASKNWARVKAYLEFYGRGPSGSASEIPATVGVVTDDDDLSYEALNLMARHNIAFRVLSKTVAKPSAVEAFNILVVFSRADAELTKSIQAFAERGGIAVLVDLGGDFPWHRSPPTKTNGHSVSYDVGKGRVIELGEAVTDPETFAQDIRRLLMKQSIPVSLWNSLTTLVASYPGEKADDVVVELVNYAEESLEVQVQVKGDFDSVRFESPERGCCETLKPSRVDGFTEFVVPDLVIGGRVYLGAKAGGTNAKTRTAADDFVIFR
jgi:hypothetical protein